MSARSSGELSFPPTNYRIKTAGPAWTFIVNRLGFVGITLPNRTIYIHPSHVGQQWLINHELAHIAQIDRDGSIKFWTLCLWYYFTRGHKDSPIEIEARRYEAQ